MITIIAQSYRIAKLISFAIQADFDHEGYFASDKYFITWTYGHMVEIETPHGNPGYWFRDTSFPVIPEKTALAPAPSRRVNEKGAPDPQLNIIKNLLSKSKTVLLALDPTMNGDLIGGYLMQYFGFEGEVKRIVLNDLMSDNIKNAIHFPVAVADYDVRYRKAALLDKVNWLINVNASRAFAFATGMNTYPLTRGAMPILDVIAKREKEIKEYAEKKWHIPTIVLKDAAGNIFSLKCNKRFGNIPNDLMSKVVAGAQATVTKFKIKSEEVDQPCLHSIMSLQDEAAEVFQMDPAETYRIARSLYEKKRISFPGPSSGGIDRRDFDDFKENVYPRMQVSPCFSNIIPEDYKPSYNKVIKNVEGVAHGIMLTAFPYVGLSNEEKKIIFLIGRRMLRTFAKSCKLKSLEMEISCQGYTFGKRQQKVSRLGHYQLNNPNFDVTKLSEEFLSLSLGQELIIESVGSVECTSKPAVRYNDSTLLEAMSKMHTPEYRENMVKDLIFLQNKGYITRNRMGEYFPTESGRALAYIIRDMEIANPKMLSYLEEEMNKVMNGYMYLDNFKEDLHEDVIDITQEILSCGKLYKPTETDICCPKCGDGVLRIFGKIAKCTNPDCGHAIFRQIEGVTLHSREIQNLVVDGTTSAIRGFVDDDGKQFVGRVKLDGNFNPYVINIQK